MTVDKILDIIAAGMLGGGIALLGNLLAIYLSQVRKLKNSKSVASQSMSIMTALAELIRNRHSVSDEAESLAQLFTGIQALIQSFREGDESKSLTPTVNVTNTGLTTHVAVDNIPKSPETSDKKSPEIKK